METEQASRLPTHAQAPMLHAGFWRRFAAFIIDYFLINAVMSVLGMIMMPFFAFGSFASMGSAGDPDQMSIGFLMPMISLWMIASIALPWIYYACFESSRLQATLGKMALGIIVTDEYGCRISFARATGRYFAKIISGIIFYIGYMMAGWTERKQALHDMLAATCVVQKGALAALDETNDSSAAVSAPASDTTTQAPKGGMPGWAVGLIVAAGVMIIVLPIIAIIVAIAIPLYLNATNWVQTHEAINRMHDVRSILLDNRKKYGGWPSPDGIAVLNEQLIFRGKYTKDVRVGNCMDNHCTIVAQMNSNLKDEDIAGKTLALWTIDYGFTWHCGPGGLHPIAVQDLPFTCRERGGTLL